MLTKHDLRYHWWSIRFFSLLGFYPLHMDPKSNRICIQRNIIKRIFHCLHLLIWFCYTVMVFYRICLVFEGSAENKLMHLACPMACVGLSIMAIIAHTFMFFIRPHYYIHGYNRIMDYLCQLGEQKKRVGSRPRHELFAIYTVQLNCFMPSAHLAAFLLFSGGSNYVYYNVPEEMKTTLVFTLCAAFEFYIFTLWSVTIAFLLFVGVLSIHMVLEQMNEGIVRTRSLCLDETMQNKWDKGVSIQNEYKLCRELQVTVQEFNWAFSTLVFISRVYYVYECIFNGFAGVRLWGDSPFLGMCFLVFGWDSMIMYILTFERAFKVPLKMEEYQKSIKESAWVCMGMGLRTAVVSKGIDSIPWVAIQVGRFNTMERASALIFLHFVVAGIVNLLLTF